MSAALSLVRASLHRLASTPDRLLRAAFGDPPRSDRGIELDLHTHALLRLMALTQRGALHELEPERARSVARRDGALVELAPSKLAEQRELEIDGPAGPLRARIYRPANSGVLDRRATKPSWGSAVHCGQVVSERALSSGRGPQPLLVWLHGGGFVIGGLETHCGMCSHLALRAECIIVAVEYRKSPEHRFPAAVDDSLASFQWIRGHAEALGARLDQIAIGGDSAGGNLSAVVCHQLRDANQPQPALQVLIYPSTAGDQRFPSRRHFSEGALLTGEMMRWFMGHYLRGPQDYEDPRASPLRSTNFDGLAPALIRTAGFDPLRDEGSAYADALAAAGVEVDYRCYERLIHNYIVMAGALPAHRQALDDLGDELRLFFSR